jgi:hypothetical protein
MQTKREYAASLGLAVAGARGRLSREAHAAIDKAISEGMTFADPVIIAKPPKPNTPKPEKQVRIKREPVAEVGLAGDVKTRYADDQIFVGTDSTGKRREVNARQVCFHCRYSLSSHHCNEPRVLIGSPLEWIEVQPKGV